MEEQLKIETGEKTEESEESTKKEGQPEKTRAALETEKAAFEKEKAEWQAKLEEARAVIFEAGVTAIARKHQVDTQALKDKAKELGLTEMEKIGKLAEIMAVKPPEPPVPRVDSGKSTGGIDTSKMRPEEKFEMGLKAEKRN